MKTTIIIAITLLLNAGASPGKHPSFSYKTYGNLANFFENENDLLDFFGFKKGDVVAEVGALDGQNIAGLALLTDSISFYAEDIDAKTLNPKHFDKLIARSRRMKPGMSNTFPLVIGTESSTLLPDKSFDKIFLSITFHEFSQMDEMLDDIYSKLKSGGKLYILEGHCFNPAHRNYTAEQTISIVQQHHFTFLKRDGKDLNNGTGLYREVFIKE